MGSIFWHWMMLNEICRNKIPKHNIPKMVLILADDGLSDSGDQWWKNEIYITIRMNNFLLQFSYTYVCIMYTQLLFCYKWAKIKLRKMRRILAGEIDVYTQMVRRQWMKTRMKNWLNESEFEVLFNDDRRFHLQFFSFLIHLMCCFLSLCA